MAYKPMKSCHKIGCPNLTKSKYCESHQELEQQDKADRNKYYDLYVRDQKSKQFYGSSEWVAVRNLMRVQTSNLCCMCLDENEIVIADVCDHIIPIKVDWNLRLELSNLQMLCHKHHRIKTLEDKQKYNL